MRITFVAYLFGELITTVLPEQVPEILEKLLSTDNVEVLKISLIAQSSDAEVSQTEGSENEM